VSKGEGVGAVISYGASELATLLEGKMQPNITKLPKWAQNHIAQLEADRASLRLKVDASARKDQAVQRDLPPPTKLDTLSRGWDFNAHSLQSNYGARDVAFPACSSCVHHGSGWERTSTQGKKALFSTRKLALLAARSSFLAWVDSRLSLLEELLQEEEPLPGMGAPPDRS
jgi:hypothetical protein